MVPPSSDQKGEISCTRCVPTNIGSMMPRCIRKRRRDVFCSLRWSCHHQWLPHFEVGSQLWFWHSSHWSGHMVSGHHFMQSSSSPSYTLQNHPFTKMYHKLYHLHPPTSSYYDRHQLETRDFPCGVWANDGSDVDHTKTIITLHGHRQTQHTMIIL